MSFLELSSDPANAESHPEDDIYICIGGPFAGRICCDFEHEVVEINDLRPFERKWFKEHHIDWSISQSKGRTIREVDCLWVTFGHYLESIQHFLVPKQFLRLANAYDLVSRHHKISEIVARSAILKDEQIDALELSDLLKERSLIMDVIWWREKELIVTDNPTDVFLCHSSADKPFVRQVRLDLGKIGHRPWLDEFEIKVGESIVSKINEASCKAGALILFLSQTSVDSEWVKKEWSSALARQLAKQPIKIFPAVIEQCEIPAILSDIKFADFRTDYSTGLRELALALDSHAPSQSLGKK